jgi:hypothetical protein
MAADLQMATLLLLSFTHFFSLIMMGVEAEDQELG